jgi:hypothetical protein
MKNKMVLTGLLLITLTSAAFAQWPGYFYAFELKDPDGNIIDSNNTNYKMTALPCCNEIVTGISICEGNKTWHFYAGGNANLDKTNSLKIERMENGSPVETMIIDFPATLSGGKEKYYRDLYAGEIKFKKGKRKVKLPKTDDDWDNLKELREKICRLSYAISVYYDISEFQK